MSTASKFTLAGSITSAIGIVTLVHYQQKTEKAVIPPASFAHSSPFSPSNHPNAFLPRPMQSSSIRDADEAILSQFMHAGVLRDVEQQRLKKERQEDFEMQKALEEEYKKFQSVNGDEASEEG